MVNFGFDTMLLCTHFDGNEDFRNVNILRSMERSVYDMHSSRHLDGSC